MKRGELRRGRKMMMIFVDIGRIVILLRFGDWLEVIVEFFNLGRIE